MKRWFQIGALCSVALITSCALVNHNDNYEVGIAWNLMTGELWLQGPGFHLNGLWTLVTRVDTRPQRVCMTSSSRAAFNCKLVEFDPNWWGEFVTTEGWRYYWFSNRLSFNFGYREEYRGIRDIFRGYAFSAKQYPFLKTTGEYETD